MKVVLSSAIVFATMLGFAACSSSTDSPVQTQKPDATTVDSAPRTDDSDLIPCGPRSVLENVCQHCHSFPTQNDAPFPLVTYSDIMINRGEGITRDLMIAQLNARRMPLAPVTITDDQRDTLLAWLESGAPAAQADACADAGTDADSGDASDDAFDASDDADASDSGDAALD